MYGDRAVTPVSVYTFDGMPSLAQAAERDQHGRAFLSLHAILSTQFDACNSVSLGHTNTLVASRGCNAGNGKREALRLTGMGGFGRL